MELKFLLLTVISLFATFGSTGAQGWHFQRRPAHNGNNNTFGASRPQATPPSPTYGGNTQNPVFIEFRQPNTYAPPIYTANAFGTSNSSAPPPRWSGSHPTTVGHGQHGHNEHRYPSYNRTARTTPGYGQNVNQFGNRNNSAGIYPSLAGLGGNGNQYRPPAGGSNFPSPQNTGYPNYPSGGNQYRPVSQGGTGTWNGTAGSNQPQPNYQNSYGNEYRPAPQTGPGTAAWNAGTGSNYPNHQFNGHHNYQSGGARYNQTAGRAPVNSGYGNQG